MSRKKLPIAAATGHAPAAAAPHARSSWIIAIILALILLFSSLHADLPNLLAMKFRDLASSTALICAGVTTAQNNSNATRTSTTTPNQPRAPPN